MNVPSKPTSSVSRPSGFTLVVSILMVTLIATVALGMLSLSAIELRKSSTQNDQAVARANARMALMQAIGQVQRNLGPDQRVSATAELAGAARNRTWTGVWSTRTESGGSFWERDAETGSLREKRSELGWEAKEDVLEWLVSGGGDPNVDVGELVEVVGAGSAGPDQEDRVSVPLMGIEDGAGNSGRIGWWVGDLGVRANVAVIDVHGEELADPGDPGNGGYHRLMTSQQADAEMISGGAAIDNELRGMLATQATVGSAGAGSGWAKEHFHDFTVASKGVLADVRGGGLKRDLTAYFESDGEVEDKQGLDGLSDDDRILDETGNASRHQLAGPRFGALRDWVRSAVPFSGENVSSTVPRAVEGANSELVTASREKALANEQPTRLGSTASSLQPVLVEASHYLQMSTFKTNDGTYQLRHHLYPRVVLWNPYNVDLDFERAIVMIQGNGRQEMWTEDARGRRLAWVSFEGGRTTNFVDGSLKTLMDSEDYHDPYMGSYYFSVPKTKFGPGECLVFSPAQSAEYDGLSAYRLGNYNLANNELSCEVGPDPSRSFYVSGSDIGGGISTPPVKFWYAPTPLWSVGMWSGVENQADDTRVVMKAMGDTTTVDFETFDALPQLAYLSASLQYGAGKEPRIAWFGDMDMELLPAKDPSPRLAPAVRTREGIRMRWFKEHPSNVQGSGDLKGTAYLDEAPFANWNPRAAYALRSPWENIGGQKPLSGSAGGPWFFGIYTRDLYDENVGWTDQTPVFRGGRYQGNPFGLPQEGRERTILFEVPRDETGVVSMGQLQNAQLSEFVWHPSFAFGNSLPDPRLGEEGLSGTVPTSESEAEDRLGGFHQNAIGWSNDNRRGGGRDAWADTARELLQNVPEGDHVVYDLSYELNHALWDRYFVSSGSRYDKAELLDGGSDGGLPNGRMQLATTTRAGATADRVNDFHQAAYHLMVDGAFNVNSTNVESWKAVLAATRGLGENGGTPFARILNPPEGAWTGSDDGGSDKAWAGRRELTDGEIQRLAEEVVVQVKERGPFLSMADFVNRRLSNDESGKRGVLQAAIDRAGLNEAFESGTEAALAIDNSNSLRDYAHPDHIRDATRLEQKLKPATKAWGAPGFLTQGDLLQVLAPTLTARSDSFVIRAYGDALDGSGKVVARAWCEAVVQRTPKPIEADESGLNSEQLGMDADFGRRFVVTDFRWLLPEEV